MHELRRHADLKLLAAWSDRDLREELTVAAMAPGNRRIERYRHLLAEWHRRLEEGSTS